MSKVINIKEYKNGKDSSHSQIKFELPNINDSTGKKTDEVVSAYQFQELLKKLNEVFQHCRIPDWNEDGAEPVSDATFDNAINLLTVLPIDLPIPDILTDNDGYIEFEWYNLGKSFSLYVTDSNLILFAGYYGKNDRLSGRFNFEGFFPDRTWQLAAEVYKEKTQ